MFKLNTRRQRMIFTTFVLLLALLVVIIIFRERFGDFFDMISEKLSVLNSLMVGAVIAYLLNPIEKFFHNTVYKKLKKNNVKKALSILSTYIFVLLVLSVFVLIALPQIIQSITELPVKLREFVDLISAKVTVWYNEFILSDMYKSIVDMLGESNFDINKILQSLSETYLNLEALLQSVTDYLLVFVKKLYTGISDTFFGLVFSIYLLAAKDRLKAWYKKITYAVCGQEKADDFLDVLKYTDHTFGGFIQGKLVNAVIITILTLIAFYIFDIPYPQLLAVIIGVTDIIPVFGPFIGAIPSAFVVLIAAPEKLIPMLLIILIIQQIDGNYIGPKILGESTGLSALGVFAAIIVMGGYFGIIGMLIGVPTFAVAIYLINRAVDRKLVERGISTDIADYYSDPDATGYHENAIHKNMFTKIADPIIKYTKLAFCKLIDLLKGTPNKNKKKRTKLVRRNKVSSDNNETPDSTENVEENKEN